MRTRHSIMFGLSNKVLQVCFQDRTEFILSSESKIVTYANKKKVLDKIGNMLCVEQYLTHLIINKMVVEQVTENKIFIN